MTNSEVSPTRPSAPSGTLRWYQDLVHSWMTACFGSEKGRNIRERCFRFLEEALELVQSLGITRADALKLVDYVYQRVEGEPIQEIGGTMVTLAALCQSAQIDLSLAALCELNRIHDPVIMQKIRDKQVSKNLMMGESFET